MSAGLNEIADANFSNFYGSRLMGQAVLDEADQSSTDGAGAQYSDAELSVARRLQFHGSLS